MNSDLEGGRVPTAPGSREPSPDGLGPSGFDPSRVQIDLVDEIRVCMRRAYEWADEYPDDPAAALFVRCADCLATVEHAAVFMMTRDSDGPRMAETNEDSARGEAGPARAAEGGIAQGVAP